MAFSPKAITPWPTNASADLNPTSSPFGRPEPKGGLIVAETPPQVRRAAWVETEQALYARKANRIVIRHELGLVVAVIEVVSPGNKDSKHAVASFTAKAVEFIRNGIHLLIVDVFPPGSRDPLGMAQAIWDELVGESLGTRPSDKLRAVAAFDAGDELTAYVDAFAVGDLLPDAPLFLARLVRQRPPRADLHGRLGRDPQAHSGPGRTTGRGAKSHECPAGLPRRSGAATTISGNSHFATS